MKNFLAVLLLCATALAAPSYTTVTATLMDSSSQIWVNATWTTEFAKPPGNNGNFTNSGTPITPNQTGVANASGVFTVVLDNNLAVSPAGSGWKFTICPNATVAACSTIVLTINGVTEDVSAAINAILIVPVVNSAPMIARAYNDTEVNGSYGALYINSVSNTLKQCIQIACNGSGWNTFGVSSNNPTFTGILTTPCVKFNFDLTNDSTLCSQPGTGHINFLLPSTGGTLALAGATGNVSNSGTPLIHQVPIWTDATHILGITPTVNSGWVLTSNGTGSDPTFQAPAGGSVTGQNIILTMPPPGIPAGNNVNPFPTTNQFTVYNPGATGPSSNQYLPGAMILIPCSSWKMTFWQASGTATLSWKLQIYKMALGSLTVISSAQVTFGGQASPTFNTPGVLLTSDAINFPIDQAHDYYLVMDTITGLPAIGGPSTPLVVGVWISTADNYGVANGVALNLGAGSAQGGKSLIVQWIAQ